MQQLGGINVSGEAAQKLSGFGSSRWTVGFGSCRWLVTEKVVVNWLSHAQHKDMADWIHCGTVTELVGTDGRCVVKEEWLVGVSMDDIISFGLIQNDGQVEYLDMIIQNQSINQSITKALVAELLQG